MTPPVVNLNSLLHLIAEASPSPEGFAVQLACGRYAQVAFLAWPVTPHADGVPCPACAAAWRDAWQPFPPRPLTAEPPHPDRPAPGRPAHWHDD